MIIAKKATFKRIFVSVYNHYIYVLAHFNALYCIIVLGVLESDTLFFLVYCLCAIKHC